MTTKSVQEGLGSLDDNLTLLRREVDSLDQELEGLEAEEQALQLLEEKLALRRVAAYQGQLNKVCNVLEENGKIRHVYMEVILAPKFFFLSFYLPFPQKLMCA